MHYILWPQGATICGMLPQEHIIYKEWTTLLFNSLYPKVVVTVRLAYFRLA